MTPTIAKRRVEAAEDIICGATPRSSIEETIAYVRSKNRPGQIDGRLLAHIDALTAEIERLNTLVADLRDALDHQTAMRQVAEGTMPLTELPPWRADPLENTPIVRGYQPRPRPTQET